MTALPRPSVVLVALSLSLAASLAGCVVAPHGTYYRPSSPDPSATFKGAWCRGQAGPTEVQIESRLAGDVADFELRLPPLRVGAATREIAPIRFERRRFDGGIEPLNC